MPDKMLRVAGRGKDGTAKALKTNNDGKLITSKSQSYKNVNAPDLAITESTLEVHNTFEPSTIDSLTFLSNFSHAAVGLGIRGSDGTLHYITVFRGNNYGVAYDITFERLQEFDTMSGGYSDYLELVNYDDGNSRYIMRNRKPIEAPHGFRVYVSRASGVTPTEPVRGMVSIGYYEEV